MAAKRQLSSEVGISEITRRLWDRRAAAKGTAERKPSVTAQLERTLSPDEYSVDEIAPEPNTARRSEPCVAWVA